MKELDKAIINNDIKHIVFLLKQNTDCKAAVLIHLKEQLVPEHFTEKELTERGAILTMAGLNEAIHQYAKVPVSFDKNDFYRTDLYIKRLYLSAQQALIAWQSGKLSNKELKTHWNMQAIEHLATKWTKEELPKELMHYAEEKQKHHIALKHQQWKEQKLVKEEHQTLNAVLINALKHFWYQHVEEDHATQQIQKNIIEQAVKLFKNGNQQDEFVGGIKQFIFNKVREQIYNNSINNEETIKYVLEDEKSQALQGKIVSNPMPYYEQAISSLFTKWQKGQLNEHNACNISHYISSRLNDYSFPGQLKTKLAECAILQLLEQYQNYELAFEVIERLQKQFESNIIGHYEKHAMKDSPFRNELAQIIFSQLLKDWNTQHLGQQECQYLQVNLLSDLQSELKELSASTSRFSLLLMMSKMQEKIGELEQEIKVLKENQHGPLSMQEKMVLSTMSDTTHQDPENSLANLVGQFGAFKVNKPNNNNTNNNEIELKEEIFTNSK